MSGRGHILGLAAAVLLAGCSGEGVTRTDQGAIERRWSDGQLPRYGGPRPGATNTAPLKVGLLLPLTGRYAAYGQSLLNAAALALFDAPSERAVDLLPRDTGGTPEGAAAAAVDAAAAGAGVLIGPALEASAAAAQRSVGASGAPLLMLSGDRRLAASGAFVAGHAPAALATQIVDFAYRRGVRVIAGLGPDTRAASEALLGMQAAAQARGMTIVSTGVLRGPMAEPELHAAIAQVLQAIGPDGALFLPFPAESLPPIARSIQAVSGGRSPILLGLADWDSIGLATLPSFGRAFFAGPDPAQTAAFRRRYAAFFGSAPPRDAALVYDLVATAQVAGSAAPGRGLSAYALEAPGGFVGVEGPFRLTREGAARRAYSIVGIVGGRLQAIEPASAGLLAN